MDKKLLLVLMVFIAFLGSAVAQEKTITGKVTSSEDGSTVPGVSVMVKGTTIGTITDVNGNYTLKVPADAKVLVFSFVGMTTKEIEIGNQGVIDVVMEPANVELDEVVVTSLGISRQ